jgi:elongation factor P hydroxylase
MIQFYDIQADELRDATQEDFDRLQFAVQVYGPALHEIAHGVSENETLTAKQALDRVRSWTPTTESEEHGTSASDSNQE